MQHYDFLEPDYNEFTPGITLSEVKDYLKGNSIIPCRDFTKSKPPRPVPGEAPIEKGITNLSEIFGSVLTLNAEFCQHTIAEKGMKYLYAYATSVLIMAGKGYMRRNEYISGISRLALVDKETASRWLRLLKNDEIIREKDGMLYIKGKRATCLSKGIKSRLHIKLDMIDLQSYYYFTRTIVTNYGLILQNRFRYCLKKLYFNKHCPHLMERIEFPVSLDPNKVGVSISYLAKKLGVSESFVQKALKGCTRKNYVFVKVIKYWQIGFHKEWLKSNPRYRIIFKNKVPLLVYTTASTIISPSRLTKRRGR